METGTYGGVGGLVSQRATTAESQSLAEGFSWNDLGLPASVTNPRITGIGSARTVSFTYTNGFLTAVPSFASSISYYPNTMLNTVAHANGVTDTWGEDPNDMARPATISASGAATNWSTGTYQYDGAGDVWHVGSDWYLYDLVTRLTEGNVGSVGQKQCAVFDAFGNILGLSQIASNGTCPTTGSYSLDSSTNRFLSPVTYDAAGNETSHGGMTYTWDNWSQIATAIGNGVSRGFLYTAEGERIVNRGNNGGNTGIAVRDLSGKVLRIFTKNSGTWSWTEDYVYRDGLLLASIDGTGTKHFHLDHLGTVRRITGTGTPAAVLASHDYYPFGLEATSSAQDTERMKFTGHERDSSIALDYMHARHYNFAVGRFLSTDLLRGDPHAPQSFNLFAYVQGNPINYVDPLGLQALRRDPDDPCNNPERPNPDCVPESIAKIILCGLFGTCSGGGGNPSAASLTAGPQQLLNQQCGAYGGGLGVSVNANVDDVLGTTGLNGALSAGWGGFFDSNSGFSNGGFASGAALVYSGNNVLATPPQEVNGNVVSPGGAGAYAGAGLSIWGSNAHSVQQLGGHFVVYQVNVGLAAAKASMSLAFGNGVDVFSASVIPATGTGIGGSVTRYVTDTATTNSGCH